MRPKPRNGEEPLTEEQLAKIAKVEITVNGEPVVEASDMGTCFALKNKNGHVWQPNSEGRYEIKIRVTESENFSYIRVSAFVLV